MLPALIIIFSAFIPFIIIIIIPLGLQDDDPGSIQGLFLPVPASGPIISLVATATSTTGYPVTRKTHNLWNNLNVLFVTYSWF